MMKGAAHIKFLALIFMSAVQVQGQIIEWQKCLGGTLDEVASSVIQTNDGGYIVAGTTLSNDGDVGGNHSLDYDYWIVKLDATGFIEWQKCFGGTGFDAASSIIQTNDNGYLVAGTTHSNDGDVSGFHGTSDYWVTKIDTLGNLQWQKCLGGTSQDFVFSSTALLQSSDGGYLISGIATSNNGDVSNNHGGGDCWLVKLDSSGSIQWQKCRGGTGGEGQHASIVQTVNAGYALTTSTRSNDADVSGNHNSSTYSDIWLAKLDNVAEMEWQKCLGGSYGDQAYTVLQSTDTGYVVAGLTRSNDGDVSGNHGIDDYWVVKVDSMGSIQWQKCYGGSDYDQAFSVIQTMDGDYVVAGMTYSTDGNVTGHHNAPGSYSDCWIVNLDNSGDIQWSYCFGGENDDEVYSIAQTSDLGYIFAGGTKSLSGDVSGNHGNRDVWVVKLSPTIGVEDFFENDADFSVYPNPSNGTISIQLTAQPSYNSTLTIYNSLGTVIFKAGIRNKKSEIDLAVHPPGVYFIKIAEDDGITVRKIVKI